MPCHSNCATHRFTVHSDIFFGVNIIGDPLILGTVGNRAVLGIQQGQKLNDWWEEDNKAISKYMLGSDKNKENDAGGAIQVAGETLMLRQPCSSSSDGTF